MALKPVRLRLSTTLETEDGRLRWLTLRQPTAADLEAIGAIVARQADERVVETRLVSLLSGLPDSTILSLAIEDFAAAALAAADILETAIERADARMAMAAASTRPGRRIVRH